MSKLNLKSGSWVISKYIKVNNPSRGGTHKYPVGHLLGSDSLQFGFKPGCSTSQCSWLVTEVASYYLRKGTNIFTTLCDCSRAFDKCRFDILFEKLLERKMPAILVRTLMFVGGSPQIYTAHQKQVPVLKINKINTISLFSI